MSKNHQTTVPICGIDPAGDGFATPAHAFDSRNGETIIIGKDEVIEDDLYINAATVVLDGTVKGDLIAFGATITINGVVEGDLMAAGQTVIITGEVKDDARIAGAAIQIGSSAVIGDDLLAAGASLEMQKGSQVGGDLVVGSGQVLIAGDVAEDVLAGTAAFELRGSVGRCKPMWMYSYRLVNLVYHHVEKGGCAHRRVQDQHLLIRQSLRTVEAGFHRWSIERTM